ncbi:MAG: hypothetical protein R6X09_04730 [Bacteroidales bacterium]
MKSWFVRYWYILLLMLAGGLSGYFYWKFVGCHSGSCPITSHWYTSAFAGSLFGYLAGSIIADYVKKPAGK